VSLEFVVAGAHRDRRQVRIFSLARFHEQRYDAVGRRRSKDDVGRFFEDGVEIENRAERFAHLVERGQNVCLALQRLEHLVALRRRGNLIFRMQHGRHHVAGGDQ
jgi:hypothetical protein